MEAKPRADKTPTKTGAQHDAPSQKIDAFRPEELGSTHSLVAAAEPIGGAAPEEAPMNQSSSSAATLPLSSAAAEMQEVSRLDQSAIRANTSSKVLRSGAKSPAARTQPRSQEALK